MLPATRSFLTSPIAASLLSGIALFAIFPNTNAAWLAWGALIPLLHAVGRSRATIQAAVFGLISGEIAYIGILYWIYPMMYFNTGSLGQSLIALLGLSTYLSAFIAAWAAGMRLADRLGVILKALFGAALWVTLEFVRTHLLGGFPWALLGYSQWSFLQLIQIAHITGVYGVSFVIVGINCFLWNALCERRWRYCVVCTGVTALMILGGVFGIKRQLQETGADQSILVAVLQGNIDQSKKWDKAFEDEIMQAYGTLARTAALQKPSVIIWPETAIPGMLPVERNLLGHVQRLVRETGCWHIAGSPYVAADGREFNATFAFSPDGAVRSIHLKTHLIPFGEFVPFRSLLGRYFGILNSLGDFSRGTAFAPLEVGTGSIGTTICSENFFGDRVRRFVRGGADFLTNQTNDAWFFKTSAPEQHFIMNVFRAIETRRTVIVAGNTGVSGIIEPTGRIARRLPIFTRDYFIARVVPGSGNTLYVRFGDLFAMLCFVFSVCVITLLVCTKTRCAPTHVKRADSVFLKGE